MNSIKMFLQYLIHLLIVMCILYLLFAFTMTEFNPWLWTTDTRGFLVSISAMGAVFTLLMSHLQKMNSNPIN